MTLLSNVFFGRDRGPDVRIRTGSIREAAPSKRSHHHRRSWTCLCSQEVADEAGTCRCLVSVWLIYYSAVACGRELRAKPSAFLLVRLSCSALCPERHSLLECADPRQKPEHPRGCGTYIWQKGLLRTCHYSRRAGLMARKESGDSP